MAGRKKNDGVEKKGADKGAKLDFGASKCDGLNLNPQDR